MNRYEAREEALDARFLGRIGQIDEEMARADVSSEKGGFSAIERAALQTIRSIRDGYAEQLTASIVSMRNGTPSTGYSSTTMKIPRDTVSI